MLVCVCVKSCFYQQGATCGLVDDLSSIFTTHQNSTGIFAFYNLLTLRRRLSIPCLIFSTSKTVLQKLELRSQNLNINFASKSDFLTLRENYSKKHFFPICRCCQLISIDICLLDLITYLFVHLITYLFASLIGLQAI